MGTAILIIAGVIVVIALIFAGFKWVMPESFTFKACAFKWFSIDLEMKLPGRQHRGHRCHGDDQAVPPAGRAARTHQAR